MFYSELLKFDQTLKGDETPSCSSIFIHPELSVILPYDESGSCETELKLIYSSIIIIIFIISIIFIYHDLRVILPYMMKVEVVKQKPS